MKTAHNGFIERTRQLGRGAIFLVKKNKVQQCLGEYKNKVYMDSDELVDLGFEERCLNFIWEDAAKQIIFYPHLRLIAWRGDGDGTLEKFVFDF